MSHDFMIPKHKRLTGQARLVEESRRAVLEFGKAVQNDRLFLLSIVTGGRQHWRKVAEKAFSGFLVSDQMLDGMFEAMVEAAGEDPRGQYDKLQRAELVNLKMEKLRGLSRFITDEAHLDEVLARWVAGDDERAAIRSQMLPMVRAQVN